MLLFPVIADSAMQTTLTPRISFQEQYDDNIDLDRDNEDSDWISIVSPGLALDFESEKTHLNLDSEVGFTFYLKDSSRDTTRYRGQISWTQQLTAHSTLQVSDTFLRSEDPILVADNQIDDISTERAVRYRNNGEARLSWQHGADDHLAVGYINRLFESKSDLDEDSLGHQAFLDVTAWAVPQFGIAFRSQFTDAEFQQPSGFVGVGTDDFSQYMADFTVRYRWPPSYRVYANYNELYQDFDQSGAAAPSNDFRVRQVALGFGLTLSPRTDFNASGGYYYQSFQSGNDQDNEGYTYKASLETRTERALLHLEAERGFRLDYFTSENRGSTEFRQVFGSANYQLTENLNFSASASYLWQDFLTRDRTDEVWRAGAEFSYSFRRWLDVSVEGMHSERESDDPRVEFVVNQVTILFTLAYPISLSGN